MKGIQISLTAKERQALMQLHSEFHFIAGEFADIGETYDDLYNNGLKSALRKLYKGLKGEDSYK